MYFDLNQTSLMYADELLKSNNIPNKNRLVRNIQILQVFFLQDLQDLALNLASLARKASFSVQDLQDMYNI